MDNRICWPPDASSIKLRMRIKHAHATNVQNFIQRCAFIYIAMNSSAHNNNTRHSYRLYTNSK